MGLPESDSMEKVDPGKSLNGEELMQSDGQCHQRHLCWCVWGALCTPGWRGGFTQQSEEVGPHRLECRKQKDMQKLTSMWRPWRVTVGQEGSSASEPWSSVGRDVPGQSAH
jgi:hypothetical protein